MSLGIGLILIYYIFKNFTLVPADLLLNYYPWKIYKPQNFFPINPLRSDILDYYLPRIELLKKAIFENNEIPLWSPLIANGRPLFTLLFNSFLHPFFLPIYLLPLPKAFSIIVIMKMFFAGFFMFLYLRRLRIDVVPAVIGGLVFSLSGFNSVWLGWPHTLVTSSSPLLFLGIEIFLAHKTLKSGVLITIAVALMVLGGFPSVAGYFFYLGIFYFIFRSLIMFSKNYNKISLTQWGVLCFKFVLLFILGIGITGIQLLPSIEYLRFIDISYRKVKSLTYLPIKSIIQLLLPFFYGNPSFYNWKGYSNFNETNGYTGVVSFIFLIGVPVFCFLRKNRVVKCSVSDNIFKNLLFFWFVSLISLTIIYKIGPFLDVIRFFPILSTNSNTRLFSIFAFSQAVGSSLILYIIGFTTIKSRMVHRVIRFGIALFLVFSAVMLSVGVYKLFLYYPVAKISKPLIFSHLPFLRWVSFVWFIFQAAVTVLLVYLLLLYKNKKRVVNILFLLFVSLDMLFFNYRQNGIVPKKYFFPETEGIKYLKRNLKPYERIATFDGIFMIPGTQLAYNINSIFTHSFYSKDHKFLISLFIKDAFVTPTAIQPLSRKTNFLSPLIDVFGVKYIILPPNGILYSSVIEQNRNVIDVGKIWKKRYVVQTFRIPSDSILRRICLLFATYKKKIIGEGKVSILNLEGETITTQSFQLYRLEDNSWKCFDFNTFLRRGKYKIKITSNADRTNSITLWYSGNKDAYLQGEAIVNQQKLSGDLNFRIYLQTKDLEDKYTLVYQGKDMIIYKNNTFDSGFYLANKILFYDESRDIKRYLNFYEFNPKEYVFVKRQSNMLKLKDLNTKKCNIRRGKIKYYSSNKVKYIINSDCVTVLVTPELWYPGWEVYVNGKKEEVLRVNLIFRGVFVPKGNSEVYFVYNPISFKVGILVSFLSLTLFLSLIKLERLYSNH